MSRSIFAHLKAIELPELSRKGGAYDGKPQTKLACILLMLTFVRTTELRGAKWDEIDLDKAEWRIPAERMKMEEMHIVRCPRQAVAVLRELQHLNGNGSTFSRTSTTPTHMSENAVLYALYRMGYHPGYRPRISAHRHHHPE